MRTLSELERDPEFNLHAFSDVSSGEYEKFYKPQPGDFVLDIGAHHGLFTERASDWVGEAGLVVAIEPHPDNFRKLLRDLGHLKNCDLIHAAVVDDERPVVELWHNELNNGGHSLFRNDQHSKPVTVPAITLGRIAPVTDGKRHLRFVKIDTEGSEFDILMSLFELAKPPIDIAFEAHSHDLFLMCVGILLSHGYRVLTPQITVGVCHARKT